MEPSPDTPTISVIVPVYTGVEYFCKLLENLRNQTLPGMEFIFIDDCGPDNTFGLAEQAAMADSRIVLIRNPYNMGPGASRNKGIEKARGEYIAFVDSDDLIPVNFYEQLYNAAKKTSALVVKGRRVSVTDDGTQIASSLNELILKKLNKGIEPVNAFTYEHTTAIFSRQLVLDNSARNGIARQDEDTIFILKAIHNIQRSQFCLTNDAVYYYRQHQQSLTHAIDGGYLLDTLLSMREKLSFLLQQPPNKSYEVYAANTFELLFRNKFRRASDSPLITTQEKINYIQEVHIALKQYLRNCKIPSPTYLTKLMMDDILTPELFVSTISKQSDERYSKFKHKLVKLFSKFTTGSLQRWCRRKEFIMRMLMEKGNSAISR